MRKLSLNASQLKLIALVAMLIDHMGLMLFPGALWMRCVGRIAFPIFAFQIAQGYRHTRNFRKYCLRMAVFAFISEIPFNLMIGGSLLYPGHQNVMFTFLLSLLALKFFDGKQFLPLLAVVLASGLLGADYGTVGVATVLLFHALGGQPALLLISLAAVHGFGYGLLQLYAVAALIPISLYNGEKGSRAIQPISYIFYPLHMLILYLIP